MNGLRSLMHQERKLAKWLDGVDPAIFVYVALAAFIVLSLTLA